ncbi:hypothetical protein GCM10027516_08800 [Niabella aquatica]
MLPDSTTIPNRQTNKMQDKKGPLDAIEQYDKLTTAFDIIVSHEQRHLEQAREVLKLLTNTKT